MYSCPLWSPVSQRIQPNTEGVNLSLYGACTGSLPGHRSLKQYDGELLFTSHLVEPLQYREQVPRSHANNVCATSCERLEHQMVCVSVGVLRLMAKDAVVV